MLVHSGIVVTFSLLFWGLILLIEEIESLEKWIPKRKHGTKPFRYFEDWYTATWGDWIGVSLIDASFGYVFTFDSIALLLAASFIAFCAVVLFHVRAMQKRHRPDSGYPKPGVISYSGTAHLLYFLLQATISIYMLITLLSESLTGIPLLCALGGGLIYMLCFFVDIERGAFALLPVPKKK